MLTQVPTPPNDPPSAPLLWDVFCRVIDNFGDLGVCWRLCADLAARGHRTRLWVDDAQALAWMAPGALHGTWPGVQVLDWAQSTNALCLKELPPADVWVEGFGCEIAPEFIAFRAMNTWATAQNYPKFPVWINLEYLSAENYVERVHALPSPVMQGPAAGHSKHFFYPGFTHNTGGILREKGLLAAIAEFDAKPVKSAWLARHGIPWQGETLVSLFCYEPPLLAALLEYCARQAPTMRLVVASGRATAAVQAVLGANCPPHITYLPPLSQTEFDHLLWCCDLNFVRGEDSLARALWAGKPLVWQIYPQADGAHHAKLEAFLATLAAPPNLAEFHRLWNADALEDAAIHALPDLLGALNTWGLAVQALRNKLVQMDDLTCQLVSFVQKKR